jgi:dynein heavy chain
MLREYSESVHSLSEIEKKLLWKKIFDISRALEPGHESLNLSSLGIPEYIDNCMRAINEFRETKKKIEKSASMIKDIVHDIEEAQILKEFDFDGRKQENM